MLKDRGQLPLVATLFVTIIVTCLAYADDRRMAAINNATYRLTTGEVAVLRNGENKHVGDGIDVAVEKAAFGHLTNGGLEDAAVILSVFPGNTGSEELHVLAGRNGVWLDVAAADLGRPEVYSLAIRRGLVVVDLKTQGPNDPMCCPTLHVVREYKLTGSRLVIAHENRKN